MAVATEPSLISANILGKSITEKEKTSLFSLVKPLLSPFQGQRVQVEFLDSGSIQIRSNGEVTVLRHSDLKDKMMPILSMVEQVQKRVLADNKDLKPPARSIFPGGRQKELDLALGALAGVVNVASDCVSFFRNTLGFAQVAPKLVSSLRCLGGAGSLIGGAVGTYNGVKGALASYENGDKKGGALGSIRTFTGLSQIVLGGAMFAYGTQGFGGIPSSTCGRVLDVSSLLVYAGILANGVLQLSESACFCDRFQKAKKENSLLSFLKNELISKRDEKEDEKALFSAFARVTSTAAAREVFLALKQIPPGESGEEYVDLARLSQIVERANIESIAAASLLVLIAIAGFVATIGGMVAPTQVYPSMIFAISAIGWLPLDSHVVGALFFRLFSRLQEERQKKHLPLEPAAPATVVGTVEAQA